MSQGEVQIGDEIRGLQEGYIPDEYRAIDRNPRSNGQLVLDMREVQREVLGEDFVF